MPASVGTVWVDVQFNVGAAARQLQTAIAGATAGATGASSGAAALERTWTQSLSNIGTQAQKVGRQMTVGLTVPLALIGKNAISSFKSFDESMTKIAALNQVPIEQVDQWRTEVRDLGKQYGVAADDVGQAMYFITSSGLEGQDAMDALKVATEGAAVELGDAKTVADVLTSAISAYGAETITAAKAGDQLAAAVRLGKGEADELAGALSQVIPLAANAGVSFGEVSGAMAAMTLSGTSADQAATQLRGLFNTMQDMPPIAQEALTQYTGLNAEMLRNQVTTEGLIPVLKRIFDAFGDNKVAMAEVFGNIRALTGIQNLFGKNTEHTLDIIKQVTEASGDLNKAWEITAQSRSKQMDIAMNNLHDAMIGVGETAIPMVTTLTNGIAGLASVFEHLPGPVKAGTAALGGLAAVAGPAAIVFGSIARGVSSMATVMPNATASAIRFADGLRLQAMYANDASRQGNGLIARMGGVGRALGMVGGFAAAAAAAWALVSNAMDNAAQEADKVKQALSIGPQSGGIKAIEKTISDTEATIKSMEAEMSASNPARWNPFDIDKWYTWGQEIDGARAGLDALRDRLRMAGEMAAQTGKSQDAFADWLAEQAAAGTKFKSTAEAMDAFAKATLRGDEAAKKVANSTEGAANAMNTLASRAKQTSDVFFAYINAEKQAADAVRGIDDARRGVTKAEQAYRDAQLDTVKATQAEADAQRDLGKATQGVTDARRKLTDAQNELNDALRGPSEQEQLDVESAQLDLAEAQKRARGRFDDPLERRRAQLDLRRAQIALGQVRGAHDERLADLRGKVADAEQGVNDAIATELNARQAVVDARNAKAQASLNEAEARDAIAIAQQGVTDAEWKALEATTNLAGATDSLQTQLGNAALNGSAFLSFLDSLKAGHPEQMRIIDEMIGRYRTMWAAAGGKEPGQPNAAEAPPPPPPIAAPPPLLERARRAGDPVEGGWYLPGFGFVPDPDRAPRRASGGPLSTGQMATVNERGVPELWSAGGKQYLLPTTNGQVTPLKPINADVKGGDTMSVGDINIYGAGDPVPTAYEVRRQLRTKRDLVGRR